MKKVVIAIPYLTGKGGTETVIKNFAEALDVKNTNDNISWKLVSFGGTKYPEWLSGWNKKVYNFFWAISSGIKDELLSLGVSPDKIYIIYNPVNVDNVISVKRSGKQNHFIYIGRIDYDGQKNVSELIRALNDVKGEWHCDLYGSVDQETKDRLLNLANDHTKSQIEFNGFYKDVWSQIKEADVLLLTSKFEGLPMTLIEAASRGIALVSSDCPTGTKDIVNKKNGYLYTPGNVKKLQSILNNFIVKRITVSSQNEVKKSVKKFSFNIYALKVIDSLLKVKY